MVLTFSRNIITVSLLVIALESGCAKTSTNHAQARPREIQVAVEATELASAFETSETRAAALYNGKRAHIKGIFTRTEQLADGNFAMTFKKSIQTFRPVRCIFNSADSVALNKLNNGDTLAITGTIEGFSRSRYFVVVEDCVVEDAEQ